MSRPKHWTERILVLLSEGTIARMDALRRDGETRMDLIREGIAMMMKRRTRENRKGRQ